MVLLLDDLIDGGQKVQGSTNSKVVLNVPALLTRPVPYQLLGRIELRPGRYNVRAALHAVERDKGGTIFANVDVPDFSREAMSLSGIALQHSPVPIAAPVEIMRGLLPVIPTTLRSFLATTAVEGWVRIHQGGKSPLENATVLITFVTSRALLRGSSRPGWTRNGLERIAKSITSSVSPRGRCALVRTCSR